uniref:NADH:ubiquinone reductase (H(+)-translocating) n=1 Tax=Therophilus festivus TaxID=1421599 RepID=A0A0A6ZKX1_9HYME|nr:NADH dehydrogenase subunit 5 [Therophilus festivus]
MYMLLFSFFLMIMFLKLLIMKINIFIYWSMFMFLTFSMEYIIFIDWMMMIFIMVIMLISSMVMIYSMNYMENEYYLNRFLILILTFILSMIFMIISPNLLSILLGWDGLGLSSFCLIMYYQNKKSYYSSMVTILMNRIGDIFIIMISSIMLKLGSWNFLFINKFNYLLLFFNMLFSITKSAQIPFMKWLPMAMAAPTPVSSLVHSSTLVTAGIYLMIRFFYLLNNNFLWLIMIISIISMFMSGMSAMFEFDIKKIIAYSTLSQLSMMFMTLSLKMTTLSFFHLINHAMFKSLIFLCSGIIIHNYLNIQDIRKINMMNLNMPIIMIIFNISSLTLCGMPFFTGFYSKDLIIEMYIINNNNLFLIMFMYMCMILTLLYSLRLMNYLNFNNFNNIYMNFYNLNNLMNNSIYLLMIMLLMFGCMMNWIFFNSLNFIILSNNYKLMINYLLIFFFIMFFMFLNIKINKIMFYYFNSMMYFFNNFKIFKLNLLIISNKIIYLLEMNWIEYLILKNYNYLNKFMIMKKYMMNLKFMIILMFFIYLMMIMFMM